MLNDARVASLGFFKDHVCSTRIYKEKKFKIEFQVLLKFAQIPPDYLSTHNIICLVEMFYLSTHSYSNARFASCADPESFARGGPTLTMSFFSFFFFFFFFGGGGGGGC